MGRSISSKAFVSPVIVNMSALMLQHVYTYNIFFKVGGFDYEGKTRGAAEEAD